MTAAPVIQAPRPDAGQADLTHENVPEAARQKFNELAAAVTRISRTMQSTAATPTALAGAEKALEEIERAAWSALQALQERNG